MHQTVFAEEAVEALFTAPPPAANPLYIDATYGGGGHSRRILSCLPAGGRLLALDCDEVAVPAGEDRLIFERCNYSQLAQVLEKHALTNVCGVLFDLGVSSMQLDNAARGFSFNADAPLDMRMDRRTPPSALQWLREVDEDTLRDILFQYGEEPEARRIARALSACRGEISTTAQLAQAVVSAKRQLQWHKHHPATRTFQAIRIAVNDELENLRKGLAAARSALVMGGRMVVIAFHSLEDRIVKQLTAVATLPGIGRVGGSDLRACGRMRRPSAQEIENNPRARSACLRVFSKVSAV